MADASVGTGNYGTWQIVVDLAGQDYSRNVSAVRVRGIIYNNSPYASSNANGVGVSVSGSYSNSGAPALSVGGHSSQTMFDWTFEIGHDANGYASVWLSAHLNATNTSNIGGPADVAVGMDLPRIPKPPSPPGIYVNNVSATQALINVTASNDNGSAVDWYGAWVATDPGFANVVSSAPGGTFWATGLRRATHYYARAQAHNGMGYSGFSGTAEFDTPATVPGAPTINGFTGIAPDQATVYASAPSDDGGSAITSYVCQIATDAQFTSNVRNIGGFVLTGLTPGTHYYVRCYATNGVGAGAWSNTGQFDTLSGARLRVAGAWVTARAYIKVNGTWLPVKIWKRHGGAWSV